MPAPRSRLDQTHCLPCNVLRVEHYPTSSCWRLRSRRSLGCEPRSRCGLGRRTDRASALPTASSSTGDLRRDRSDDLRRDQQARASCAEGEGWRATRTHLVLHGERNEPDRFCSQFGVYGAHGGLLRTAPRPCDPSRNRRAVARSVPVDASRCRADATVHDREVYEDATTLVDRRSGGRWSAPASLDMHEDEEIDPCGRIARSGRQAGASRASARHHQAHEHWTDANHTTRYVPDPQHGSLAQFSAARSTSESHQLMDT